FTRVERSAAHSHLRRLHLRVLVSLGPRAARFRVSGRGYPARLAGKVRLAMQEIVGLAPSGSMGSGYNLEAFERGLAANPHFIGQDAGTTDTGPYYHGTGL